MVTNNIHKACELWDSGNIATQEVYMAKLLCSEAAWKASESCMESYGEAAFAIDNDIERK